MEDPCNRSLLHMESHAGQGHGPRPEGRANSGISCNLEPGLVAPCGLCWSGHWAALSP